jgi:nitroimidazol reductase NimA-like FMN-containing flavoprotein (pyridoxamine 5'-phosphate oxidase superfamily)
MSVAMTQNECQAFLANDLVAIMSVQRDRRGPLSAPVWYAYDPGGEVQIWTGGDSVKTRLARKAGRFTVCVQLASPPYKYVTVDGPVVAIDKIDFDKELRPLVHRYLGQEEGDQYLDELGGREGLEDDVLIRMAPEHWYSEDHSREDEAV